MTVSGLLQKSSAFVSSFISQTSTVGVSFSSTFSGSWNAATTTGTVTATGGSCSNLARSGSCRGALFPNSNLTANALSGVSLSFGVVACGNGWQGDPEGEYIAPISPPLTATRPGVSTNLSDQGKWKILADKGTLSTGSYSTLPNGFKYVLPFRLFFMSFA